MRKKEYMLEDEARRRINLFLDGITEALEEEEELNFIGFGRFYKKKIASRMGRNPATGEAIKIPEYMKISLRAGKNLIEAVNRSDLPEFLNKNKKCQKILDCRG